MRNFEKIHRKAHAKDWFEHEPRPKNKRVALRRMKRAGTLKALQIDLTGE